MSHMANHDLTATHFSYTVIFLDRRTETGVFSSNEPITETEALLEVNHEYPQLDVAAIQVELIEPIGTHDKDPIHGMEYPTR